MIKIPTMSRPSIAYFSVLLAILATGIAIVAGNTQVNETSYTDQTTPSSQQTTQGVAGTNTTITSNNSKQNPATIPVSTTTQPVPSPSQTTTTTTPSNNTPQTATQKPAAMLTVTLRINDIEKGIVTLNTGNNHCDVLSKALATGVIQSLDMRYDTTYKTNGIYGINGQGNGNTVWWVFEVNGKSPPFGCSNVLVKDNDSVNWKYIRG